MFLPLISAFVKGAAEGAEEMLDQEALSRYEAVAALKKAAQDNPPGTIGPFTFKTGNKPGSYEYGQQQLNNLNSALGTPQGQAQFAAWVAENDPEGNTIKRELEDAIGIWSAKNQKTIREDGKPDAIIAPSFRKTYGNIYRFLNPTSTALQDRRAEQPSGPTLDMLKRESLQRGYIVPYNGSTAWSAGLNLFPSAPAPSLPSERLVEPEYQSGVASLASTLAFKKSNGLNMGDVSINPNVGINASENADIRRVVSPIQFGPADNPQTTSMAKTLNERNSSLNAEKVAVANNLWFSTSAMDREDQVPEVGLITQQFQLAHVPRDFKPAAATERQIAITPSGGSVGAIQYDSNMGVILINSRDQYSAQIKEKNSPLAKQIEMRQYQYDANLRLVNMTGTLLDYLERGVGNNMYDAFKRFGGGIKGILSEIGDDMFGADEDGSAAKLEYESIKSEIGALTGDSTDSAVYAALERLTAFAMAQIVQNKTDKISNKDVDEMKEVLGGPFRNKEQAAAVLRKFRSMALKSLLRVAGFAGGVGPRGALSYEKYYAANAQYQYFNRVSPSLATAEAAAKHMKNRTINMPSYGSAGSFRMGGINQDRMKIYVGGEPRTRKLGGMNNLQSALVYAYQDTVDNYRGLNSTDIPDWARDNTLSIQKQIVKNIREGSIDTSLNQDSETFKLAQRNQDDLVKHAVYIQDKSGSAVQAAPVVLHLKDAGFMVAFMNKDKELFFLENNVGASIFADQDALEKAIRARPEYEVKKPPTTQLAMGGSVSITDRLRGMVQNV